MKKYSKENEKKKNNTYILRENLFGKKITEKYTNIENRKKQEEFILHLFIG